MQGSQRRGLAGLFLSSAWLTGEGASGSRSFSSLRAGILVTCPAVLPAEPLCKHVSRTEKPAVTSGFERLRGKDSNLDYLVQRRGGRSSRSAL